MKFNSEPRQRVCFIDKRATLNVGCVPDAMFISLDRRINVYVCTKFV